MVLLRILFNALKVSRIRQALVIPDCHRPYHSERSWALCLEIASSIKLDEIVLLGDFADFYSVSRYLRDPRMNALLEREVTSVNEGLDQLDKGWPALRKTYLFGNHEKRLDTLIHSSAPALAGLVECSQLFSLPERKNWVWQDFDRHQGYRVLGSQLLARHRPLANNPQAQGRKSLQATVYGDVHRIEQAHVVASDGQDYVSFSPGWLGDIRSKAFDYLSGPGQWTQGFAIVSLDSSGKFFHEIVEIKSGVAVFRGKRFKA